MSESVSYRLSAPNQRAFEPTPLEVAYAQMLPRAGTTPMLGFQYEAEVNARNARDEYKLAQDEFNKLAMDAGNRAEANANLRDRMRMLGQFANNPESAFLYSLTQREIAPNAYELGQGYSRAGLDLMRSRAAENFAQAANANAGGSSGTTPEERALNADRNVLIQAERFSQREGDAAARRAASGLGIRMIPGTDIPAGRGPLTPDEREQIEFARRNAISRSRDEFLGRTAPHLRRQQQQGNTATPPPTTPPPQPEPSATQDESAAAPPPASTTTQPQPTLTARGQRAAATVPNYNHQTHKLVAGPNNTVQVVERSTNRVVGSFADPGQ